MDTREKISDGHGAFTTVATPIRRLDRHDYEVLEGRRNALVLLC
jgi:hypothetical protein